MKNKIVTISAIVLVAIYFVSIHAAAFTTDNPSQKEIGEAKLKIVQDSWQLIDTQQKLSEYQVLISIEQKQKLEKEAKAIRASF